MQFVAGTVNKTELKESKFCGRLYFVNNSASRARDPTEQQFIDDGTKNKFYTMVYTYIQTFRKKSTNVIIFRKIEFSF